MTVSGVRVRWCPKCQSERPLTEAVCQGEIDGQACGWPVHYEPDVEAGWRPPAAAGPAEAVAAPLTCPGGHQVASGDLMYPMCFGEVDATSGASAATTRILLDAPTGVAERPSAGLPVPTEVHGWRVRQELPNASREWTRYAVEDDEGRQGVLTLYRSGNEPDPAVHAVLRRMDRDHLPELYATGRWEDRAYEVTEAIRGATLREAGYLAAESPTMLRRIVDEMGRALAGFQEHGLRHRDLTPDTVLLRSQEPLDLVITGFGSARLSDFDLEAVAPLELTRYSSPEAIVGGVSAAGDWWSLGVILLEQLTRGACFQGVNDRAFHIHIVTRGLSVPGTLGPEDRPLLRGLLARDPLARWQWPQIQAWLAGNAVAPPEGARDNRDGSDHADEVRGPALTLGGVEYRSPERYALAAAEASQWEGARDALSRGEIATWLNERGSEGTAVASVRRITSDEALDEDVRLGLALLVLNPALPLALKGEIVTPAWLLRHPAEGYAMVTGACAEHLRRLGREPWLVRLGDRAKTVRERAAQLEITLDEERLRTTLLATSRSNLESERASWRRIFPDAEPGGVAALLEHERLTDEELIVLLCATVDQFLPLEEVLRKAETLAREAGVERYDATAAAQLLSRVRRDIYADVDARTAGFAQCQVQRVNEWADAFRVERRITLPRAAVLLSVPKNAWQEPPKQAYVAELLGVFEKRVTRAVLQGPLVRFTIGKTTPRVDLAELESRGQPAAAILDHLLRRSDVPLRLNVDAGQGIEDMLGRLRRLVSHARTFRRDTGIDGRYLGYPFLVMRDSRLASPSGKPRILPILLWPVTVDVTLGAVPTPILAFDREREDVRLNPALEGLLGHEAAQQWFRARDELLLRTNVRAQDVMHVFGSLATAHSPHGVPGAALGRVPGRDAKVATGQLSLHHAAALFNAEFTGQAIAEDLRRVRGQPVIGTSLAAALRVEDSLGRPTSSTADAVGATNGTSLYLTAASDPSQESAVSKARLGPGLLVEGPPGTGKSQTIVNVIADSIGHGQSVLVVCQKQAALDVVLKRLEAEGLGDRVFAVTDVNQDRRGLIQALREQLVGVRSMSSGASRRVRQERQEFLARLQALEADLTGHHESLRAVDDVTGMTYRQIVAELIALADVEIPVALPTLRAWLGSVTRSQAAALEETVVALASVWVAAQYEESPLHSLRQGSAEATVVKALTEALTDFQDAERRRDEVLRVTPPAFEVEDPEPYDAWLANHATRFEAADDATYEVAGRWTGHFAPANTALPVSAPRRAAGDEPAGPRLIVQLNWVLVSLAAVESSESDARLLAKLVAKPASLLTARLQDVTRATAPVTFLQSMSPARWAARRRAKGLLKELGEEPTESRLVALQSALALETVIRPDRHSVQSVQRTLAVTERRPLVTPAEIEHEAREVLARLRPIAELVGAAVAFPEPERMLAVLRSGRRDSWVAFRAELSGAFERCTARVASLAALDATAPWLGDNWLAEHRAVITGGKAARGGIDAILGALPTVAAFQTFRARAKSVGDDALRVFRALAPRRSVLEGLPPARQASAVRDVLRRELYLGWKDRIESERPALLLEREELAQKVARLAEVDTALRERTRSLLASDIDPATLGSAAEWEDITRLQGRRALRLRELLPRGAELGLFRLRPVWLMNPDTASRLLPLRAGLFDVVVFDEASQMLVEHATPTLFRARRAVISGDDKQMPPTSFFRGRSDGDDDEEFDVSDVDDEATSTERALAEETWNRHEIKDCPDLLALAGGALPRTTLQIHYRSKYRELIEYSNAAFYAARLSVPARHPDAEVVRVRPLEVIRVDGVYEAQTNPAEADRVVAWLAEHWTEPAADCPSIGVVTFNRKQADLIEERLEARAARDPAFLAAYAREQNRRQNGEDMGFFVKNVENVQGDERDVIVFSTTFGRDRAGAFKRVFGVLGQAGGERRLNVAVTRAREKVVLVTSMPIGDISDMLATRRRPDRPRDFLQAYLDYATKVSAGELELARIATERLGTREAGRTRTAEHDAFVEAVEGFVSGLGYEVGREHDGDTFGINLAVVDRRTGQYGLAIECDSPWDQQGHLRTARARELWRPSVIRRAIPATYRVWSQAWLRATEEEQQRLRVALEEALGPVPADLTINGSGR